MPRAEGRFPDGLAGLLGGLAVLLGGIGRGAVWVWVPWVWGSHGWNGEMGTWWPPGEPDVVWWGLATSRVASCYFRGSKFRWWDWEEVAGPWVGWAAVIVIHPLA